MTPYTRNYLALVAAGWLALVALVIAYGLAGCSRTYDAPPAFPSAASAPEAAPTATATVKATTAVKPPLAAATQRAARLTPVNVEKEKPPLLSELGESWTALLSAVATAKNAETHATQTDAAAAKLLQEVRERDKALATATQTIEAQNAAIAEKDRKIAEMNDSFTRWLVGAGILGCIGLAVYGGYIAFAGNLKGGVPMIGAGLVGVGVGIAALTMEHFFYTYEKPIGIGLCILGVAGLIIGGYFAYRRLNESALAAVKGVSANIAAGNINLASAGPIFKAVETPLLASIVDRHAPEVVPTPNLASPANGFASVSPKPTATPLAVSSAQPA